MLGEIQYGGRVTDDYDKRLLNTFAKVWFSSKLFTDDYQFCPDIPKYKIQNFKLQEEYLQALADMDTVDQPQVYGLHPNGDIAYQTNTTNTVLDTILSIEPKDSSGSVGESRESLVARLANDMLEKMPAIYDPFEMREKLREMGLLNPMVIFLRQELDRMRVVCSVHFSIFGKCVFLSKLILLFVKRLGVEVYAHHVVRIVTRYRRHDNYERRIAKCFRQHFRCQSSEILVA